jgi:pimeloyl-ACP methyl ester carboxylesterase
MMVFMVVSGSGCAGHRDLGDAPLLELAGQPSRSEVRGHPLPGGISEKVRLDINGFEQGMFLSEGVRADAPLPLRRHAEFLAGAIPRASSQFVSVVGTARRRVAMRPGMRWNRYRGTTGCRPLALTNDLRRRFGKDRVYVMGHSGGSFLGMHAVARAPELYHAYIGVAQMANQLRSEKRAYDYMLGRCGAERRAALARKLEAAPVTRRRASALARRDEAMHALGVGTMGEMRSVVTGLFLPSLRTRDYTLAEKINMWRGKAATGVSSMLNEMLAVDLAERVPAVGVPVYLLHGAHDYTCTCAEASAYFDRLTAPLKGFYTFSESAHSPMFEEPDRFMTILREDVLNSTNRLADRT